MKSQEPTLSRSPRRRFIRSASATSIRCKRGLGHAALVVVLAAAGRAQAPTPCFQQTPLFYFPWPPNTFAVADYNGDGLADAVVTMDYVPPQTIVPPTLSVLLNQGGTSFGNPTLIYTSPAQNERFKRVRPADLDGDGDVDVAVLTVHEPFGSSPEKVGVWRNDGAGGFTFMAWTDVGNLAVDMVVADLDGDADADVLINIYAATGTLHVLRNDGTGTFTTQFWPYAGGYAASSTAVGDVDGDGDVDIVATEAGVHTDVLLNVGPGSFVVGSSLPAGGTDLVDLDGDGDLDLPGRSAAPYVIEMEINQGNGTFVPGSTIYTPATDWFWSDVDTDGDIDFVDRSSLFWMNQGNGTFVPAYPPQLAYVLTVADFNNDGDVDLLTTSGLQDGCGFSGTWFCTGDGSATACPCGNASPVGAGTGCLNSLGSAGRLRGTGTAQISSDTFRLEGSGMPNSSALFYQGTTRVASGAGAVFGDGLRCAGGAIVRLATKTNVTGSSQFPAAGDPLISVRGMVTAPGTRTYQVWYRSAALFCTPSTFNLTNGLEVAWGS